MKNKIFYDWEKQTDHGKSIPGVMIRMLDHDLEVCEFEL